MEINMCVTCKAILYSLFLVILWADVKADENRFDAAVIENDINSLNKTVAVVKGHIDILNITVSNVKSQLEKVEEDVLNVNATLEMKIYEMRKQLKNTVSVQEFRNEIEKLVNDFRSELADVKRELTEKRNALELHFTISLEALNETLQRTARAVPEDLRQEIAQLKAEQQQRAAADIKLFENSKAFQDALREITENFVSKDELKELLRDKTQNELEPQRDKREISNKCSLNVRHKPEDGRFDVRLVMDPPCTEAAASN